MKNLLLISYWFPPRINGGVARPYSLFRYLPRYGWDVLLITQKDSLKKKKEVNIYREDSVLTRERVGNLLYYAVHRIVKIALGMFGWRDVPDLLWIKNVVNTGAALIRKQEVSAVYATYPSMDALRAGYQLAKKHKLPLFIEFRDGLTFEPLRKHSLLYKPWVRRFESKVVGSSKSVITIGENLSGYYRTEYPDCTVFTVHNGYDPEDFLHLPQRLITKREKTKIFSFGSLGASRPRDVSPLFNAFSQARSEGLISDENTELCLVGKHTNSEKAIVRSLGLTGLVKFYPPMKKSDGFSWMTKEGSYLLFYGMKNSKTVISTKLLEYLNLGIPILGVCEGNEAADIIRRTGTGEVCGFEEISILSLIRKMASNMIYYRPDRTQISCFDRSIQAKEISKDPSRFLVLIKYIRTIWIKVQLELV